MLLVVVESLPETGGHEAAVEGRQPGLGIEAGHGVSGAGVDPRALRHQPRAHHVQREARQRARAPAHAPAHQVHQRPADTKT